MIGFLAVAIGEVDTGLSRHFPEQRWANRILMGRFRSSGTGRGPPAARGPEERARYDHSRQRGQERSRWFPRKPRAIKTVEHGQYLQDEGDENTSIVTAERRLHTISFLSAPGPSLKRKRRRLSPTLQARMGPEFL